jgi:hypothetical protein
LIAARHSCDSDASLGEGVGCFVGAIELNALGIALTSAGVATVGGTAIAPTLDVPQDQVDRNPEPRVAVTPRIEPTLVELTERASMAGRAGKCAVVVAIAETVELRDPDYRFGGFAADGAIAGCL